MEPAISPRPHPSRDPGRREPAQPALDHVEQLDPDILTGDLERLGERLDAARAEPAATDLLQDLETAYEELRVADEEVRAQQDAIQRLVDSHRDLRLQQERTMAIMPVPVVVTDLNGMIRAVNAAAAVLADVRVARLLNKPVFGLFSTADRPDLRRLVAGRGREGLVVRHTATVLPRAGEPVSVEVTASIHHPGAGDGEISWVLLVSGAQADEGLGPLTQAMTRLAALPRRGSEPRAVLDAAVEICREGLQGAADVSVAVGSPLQPDAVASTSEVAQAADGAQLMVGEGPTVTAHERATTVETGDVRDDVRWPRLAEWLAKMPETPEMPGAVLAAAVESGDRVAGTLTAYATGSRRVSAESVELLAVTVGGVLHELELLGELERLGEDMQRALSSRAVIDQAKGIIMAARGLDADQAWQHLVKLSSSHHRKVRDVAADIVQRAARRH